MSVPHFKCVTDMIFHEITYDKSVQISGHVAFQTYTHKQLFSDIHVNHCVAQRILQLQLCVFLI